MGSSASAASQYLRLLRSAEGAGAKLELGAGIGRAVLSRLVHGRGALHVRRPIVLSDRGMRWFVPAFDNSFASAAPGEANSPVVPELLARVAASERPVCLDIGANLGFVCMTVAQRHPRKRVVAIEPIPWLADALRRTATLNGLANVTVVNRAVAPEAELELAVPRVRGVWLTTLSSGAAHASHEARRVDRDPVRVEASPLDEIIENALVRPEDVGVIKIDVEGLEPEVLATGRRVLSTGPAVLFEALDAAARARVESVLRESGYARFEPIDGTNFVATTGPA